MLSVDFGFAKTSNEEKNNADEAVAVVCKKFLLFNVVLLFFMSQTLE